MMLYTSGILIHVIPPDSALPSFTTLPSLEEVEVTSAYVQSVAHHLQGRAGPGGCDASHWHDILLHCGISSACLCDTVASLCCWLCNSVVPWDDVMTLLRCTFLFNIYKGWSVLVLKGPTTLLYSKEGITQGDPLSMFMYAVGTLPLIRSLHNPTHWTQLWYADDASVDGFLSDLHDWFSLLCSCGRAFGYFPVPTKSLMDSVFNE